MSKKGGQLTRTDLPSDRLVREQRYKWRGPDFSLLLASPTASIRREAATRDWFGRPNWKRSGNIFCGENWKLYGLEEPRFEFASKADKYGFYSRCGR
jgi:hypothetical protein